MEPSSIALIILLALVCEFIDSSMGMLYGTILSPLLIVAGFSPGVVIPSILLSQAIGGLIASVHHHKLANADFWLKIRHPKVILAKTQELGFRETLKRGVSRDLRATFFITILGVAATVISVLIAVNIPQTILKAYIGLLVLAMGFVLLSKLRFNYTWKKMLGVGALSSFNKGLSGGGFGPITTAGQMIVGRDGKAAVGTTTLSEAPICIAGFSVYLITRGIADWYLPVLLTLGSAMGAMLGPRFTSRFKDDKKVRQVFGLMVCLLGIWTLMDTLI